MWGISGLGSDHSLPSVCAFQHNPRGRPLGGPDQSGKDLHIRLDMRARRRVRSPVGDEEPCALFPRSPLRSSAQCTKRREMRSGIKTTNPLLISLEPAIGLEPMTCALRVRCSTTELRRPEQKNCTKPATPRVIASGALHRMVQGERSNRGLSKIASALRASQ